MFFWLDNNMLFEKLLLFQDLVPATSIVNGGSLHEENKIKKVQIFLPILFPPQFKWPLHWFGWKEISIRKVNTN